MTQVDVDAMAEPAVQRSPDLAELGNGVTSGSEVPIAMLTSDGKTHGPGDKEAVIGTYGATERRQIAIRHKAEMIRRLYPGFIGVPATKLYAKYRVAAGRYDVIGACPPFARRDD